METAVSRIPAKKSVLTEERVVQLIGTTLPNLSRIERYLSPAVMACGAVLALGFGGMTLWAAKIFWENSQKAFIEATVKELQDRADGPVAQLASMNEVLNSTFRSQVDSGTFKVLKFGCTSPAMPAVTGFSNCSLDAAQQFRAQEDQTILFVANPKHQVVRLDISVYPIDKLDRLQPLLLQLFVEPPPMGASASGNGRVRLQLEAKNLISGGGEVLQNGLLRLVTPSGMLQASLDLTELLANKSFSGPMQLRFKVMRTRGSANSGDSDTENDHIEIEPAKGTELFFVRTITSAYHSIGGFKKASLSGG